VHRNQRKYRTGIRILVLTAVSTSILDCIPGMQKCWLLYNATVTVDNY